MSMGNGNVAEINVTPLIDVLLVLLIIFMVIVPVTPRGLQAAVPQPSSSPSENAPAASIVLEVLAGRDGNAAYRLNSQAIEMGAVGPALRSLLAGRADKTIFVRGTPDLRYESVAEVVDVGHASGAENIGILTPGSMMPN